MRLAGRAAAAIGMGRTRNGSDIVGVDLLIQGRPFMSLPEMDSPGPHWSACLLLVLQDWNDSDDGWMKLRDAQEQATVLAKTRFNDEPLALKTMSNLKRALIEHGYIQQQQKGKHYYLALDERGVEAYGEIIANPDWGTPDSPTAQASARAEDVSMIVMKRVGKDHKLGKALWGSMMKQLLAGEIDLLIIPRTMKTKAKYWDE